MNWPTNIIIFYLEIIGLLAFIFILAACMYHIGYNNGYDNGIQDGRQERMRKQSITSTKQLNELNNRILERPVYIDGRSKYSYNNQLKNE